MPVSINRNGTRRQERLVLARNDTQRSSISERHSRQRGWSMSSTNGGSYLIRFSGTARTYVRTVVLNRPPVPYRHPYMAAVRTVFRTSIRTSVHLAARGLQMTRDREWMGAVFPLEGGDEQASGDAGSELRKRSSPRCSAVLPRAIDCLSDTNTVENRRF